jgi:hypothetical protein
MIRHVAFAAGLAYSLPVAAQELATISMAPVVASEARTQLGFFTKLHADCTADGFVTIRVLKAPNNGTIDPEDGVGYPAFAQENQRYKCNERQVTGTRVLYQSKPGFKGVDVAEIEAIYEGGFSRKYKLRITVK